MISISNIESLISKYSEEMAIKAPKLVEVDTHDFTLLALNDSSGAYITVSKNTSYLNNIDLDSAIIHELYHIKQITEGFPMLYAVEELEGYALQIQSIVTDIFVTYNMFKTYPWHTKEVTKHRINSMFRWFGEDPNIDSSLFVFRLPVVQWEVNMFFKELSGEISKLESMVFGALADTHIEKMNAISSSLNGINITSADVFDGILSLYEYLVKILCSHGKTDIINSNTVLLRLVGD